MFSFEFDLNPWGVTSAKKISRKRLWKPEKNYPCFGRNFFYFSNLFPVLFDRYIVFPSCMLHSEVSRLKTAKYWPLPGREIFCWPQWTRNSTRRRYNDLMESDDYYRLSENLLSLSSPLTSKLLKETKLWLVAGSAMFANSAGFPRRVKESSTGVVSKCPCLLVQKQMCNTRNLFRDELSRQLIRELL